MLDFRELLEDEEEGLAERKRREYEDRQIQSLLVMPILYETHDGRQIPIAFFYVESPRGETIGLDELNQLKEQCEEIVHRIEDASLITVKERQNVINVSDGGVALELDHPDLVKYVPYRKSITFDLIFRMQAPLRFRGTVRHIHKSGPTSIIVGLNLEGSGHSDFRTGTRDRLSSLIRNLAG